MKISLLTGGDDPTYALPLTSALVSKGITVDFIGNDAMQNVDAVKNISVNYFNLRGDQDEHVPTIDKVIRILKYYFKLLKYSATTDSKLFHILWLNKFVYFDRTILNMYYKVLGKKVVFTAHNINAEERDGNDSLINRWTLKIMYNRVDHIFVHTNQMKQQLIKAYSVKEDKVTVIPFGINNAVPITNLTSIQAKQKLSLIGSEKVVLFFGQIAPYKGLDYLVSALTKLKMKRHDFRLIIAGKIKAGNQSYWGNINKTIDEYKLSNYIIPKIEFIPDKKIEVYFKAADVLILPYRRIFQTGVLFLSYNFGLPAIATDVGAFREDIIEGKTGFICKPEDPQDLADKIDLYFNSDLFKNLEENRERIVKYAREKYSWEKVGEKTWDVYNSLI